jgi:hypothetical protein
LKQRDPHPQARGLATFFISATVSKGKVGQAKALWMPVCRI